MADDEFRYSSGFGNEFVTEAVEGALPVGRNSPQQAPLGLYAEQLSGTAFTQPRGVNRRTWVYRILPSAKHPPFQRIDNKNLKGTPFDELEPDPNRLRWDPLPLPGRGRAAGLHRRPVHRRGQRRHQDAGPAWRSTCTRPTAR